jgi:hypothetical protein
LPSAKLQNYFNFSPKNLKICDYLRAVSITYSVNKYEGTAADWFDAHKTVRDGGEILQVKDYNGRIWEMERDKFAIHNRGKQHGGRTIYLDAVIETAASPDEVWIGRELPFRDKQSGVLNSYVMIKYYKDAALAVAGHIVDDKLCMRTWFPINRPHVRRGILIKK